MSNFLISEASCKRASFPSISSSELSSPIQVGSFWHGVTLCDPPSEVGLSASGEASDLVNG